MEYGGLYRLWYAGMEMSFWPKSLLQASPDDVVDNFPYNQKISSKWGRFILIKALRNQAFWPWNTLNFSTINVKDVSSVAISQFHWCMVTYLFIEPGRVMILISTAGLYVMTKIAQRRSRNNFPIWKHTWCNLYRNVTLSDLSVNLNETLWCFWYS